MAGFLGSPASWNNTALHGCGLRFRLDFALGSCGTLSAVAPTSAPFHGATDRTRRHRYFLSFCTIPPAGHKRLFQLFLRGSSGFIKRGRIRLCPSRNLGRQERLRRRPVEKAHGGGGFVEALASELGVKPFFTAYRSNSFTFPLRASRTEDGIY